MLLPAKKSVCRRGSGESCKPICRHFCVGQVEPLQGLDVREVPEIAAGKIGSAERDPAKLSQFPDPGQVRRSFPLTTAATGPAADGSVAVGGHLSCASDARPRRLECRSSAPQPAAAKKLSRAAITKPYPIGQQVVRCRNVADTPVLPDLRFLVQVAMAYTVDAEIGQCLTEGVDGAVAGGCVLRVQDDERSELAQVGHAGVIQSGVIQVQSRKTREIPKPGESFARDVRVGEIEIFETFQRPEVRKPASVIRVLFNRMTLSCFRPCR